MRLKADITLLVISVIWGSAFAAQRVAGQLGSVYFFNGARYVLAALVVLPFAGRNIVSFHGREQVKWMFIAGFLLFIASAAQQAGMVYTTAGNAGFITSLYVVLIPVFLFLFWREKQHWMVVLAAAMAGAGAFLLSTGGRFEVRAGDALEFVGALFWAIHVILLGRFASRFEPLSFSVGQLAVCGVLNFALGVFTEKPMSFSPSLFGAVAYTAVFSLGLCYTLQVWAQRHTPPADAALILSLESVFAVIFGWLLLNETLTSIQMAGCFMIFAAVALSQVKEWKSGTIDRDRLVEGR